MDISRVINNVLFRYPIFGNIIVNLDVKHTNENVPAPAFTDGKTIYYKEEFFKDYDEEEQEFIISHEIFHVVLSHIFRNSGKDVDLLNYVEDAIINQLLLKDGLKMPDGLVNVSDALEYSVDELYMKLLPQIKQIKEWMGANTYHIDLGEISLEELFSKDLQELMSDNSKLRDEMVEGYKVELEMRAEEAHQKSLSYGNSSLGIEFPASAVGTAKPLLSWQDLLKENIKKIDDDSVSFFEVEMDGIIRKENKEEEQELESEIVIDSSGSMDIEKIKSVLRECKNILSTSKIKVGFCDTEFYGWHDIKTSRDIDELNIIGRGGTNFLTMSNSFSNDIDNKIVITDGCGQFPVDRPDILWIIINYRLPYHLDPNSNILYDWMPKVDISKINFIFIDEEEICLPSKGKQLLLKK